MTLSPNYLYTIVFFFVLNRIWAFRRTIGKRSAFVSCALVTVAVLGYFAIQHSSFVRETDTPVMGRVDQMSKTTSVKLPDIITYVVTYTDTSGEARIAKLEVPDLAIPAAGLSHTPQVGESIPLLISKTDGSNVRFPTRKGDEVAGVGTRVGLSEWVINVMKYLLLGANILLIFLAIRKYKMKK